MYKNGVAIIKQLKPSFVIVIHMFHIIIEPYVSQHNKVCYCYENIKLTILKESTHCLLTNHYNDNLLNDWYVTSMLTNMIFSHYVIVKYAGFLLMAWCLFGARWCSLTGIHQYQVMTWIVTQFQEMSLWNAISSDTRTSSNSSLCIIHEMVMGFACISSFYGFPVI